MVGKLENITAALSFDSDPLGAALFDWDNGIKNGKIEVLSPLFDVDYIPVSYLNRSFNNMPLLERIALQECSGRILDVGCGSGSHVKYLSKSGFVTEGIDLSAYAVKRLIDKGYRVSCQNYFHLQEGKYDTILMLMNGLGIAGTIKGFFLLLTQAKKLLNKDGVLIFDSSDLSYLHDGTTNTIHYTEGDYFGELEYSMNYNGVKGEPFSWLFLDQFNLMEICREFDCRVEIIHEDNHHAYLARIRFY